MNIAFRFATLVSCGIALSTVFAADAPKPIQSGKGHPFVCTDYSQGKVFIVNSDGKAEWEYQAGSCNDLWVLPNGNLLFNTGHGVLELTRDKQVVFEYRGSTVKQTVKSGGTTKEVEGASEIYACQRLSNGNTFIGECNSGRLITIRPDGKIVRDIHLLPDDRNGGHAFIRNARVLANGNYLVTHYGEGFVREYDPDGKMIREIPAPGGPHSVCRLPNGNTLISVGDRKGDGRIFEVDPDGKVVWQVTSEDLPGISIKFASGFQRLPNGNTVITNWLGHKQFGKAPHIIEVTRDKKVVWTFSDHQTMKTISNIQLLDVPGDCTKGEVLH